MSGAAPLERPAQNFHMKPSDGILGEYARASNYLLR